MAEGATFELEHAIGFAGDVPQTLFQHPNGRELVYAAGGCVVACDKQDPHQQTFFRGHDDNVSCLALSSSGRFVASGQRGKSSDVIVWDYEARSSIFRCEEHDAGVASVAFTHDEKLLATLGAEGDTSLVLWDMASGQIVSSANVPGSDSATCVAWGGFLKDVKKRPTSSYVLATCGQAMVVIYTLDPFTGTVTQQKCRVTGARVREYTSIAFSDDGDWLFCGSTSGDFSCFSVSGAAMVSLTPVCSGGVYSIFCSTPPSGPQDDEDYTPLVVTAGGGDGTLTEFRTANASSKGFVDTWRCHFAGGVSSIAVHERSAELFVGTTKGLVAFCTPGTDAPAQVWAESHFGSITAVAFYKDISDQFATVSTDGTLRIWDLNDYHVYWWCSVPGAREAGLRATSLVWSIGCLISGWNDGKIRCHSIDTDAGTRECLWMIDDAHVGGVSALVMSGSEKFFVSGGEDGSLRLWDIKSRELVSNLKQHSLRITSIALADDHVHAITASRDRCINVWDLRDEKLMSYKQQRMGGINAVALHPNQRIVLSAGQEKKVTYWDVTSRTAAPSESIKMLNPAHDGEVNVLRVASGGALFATGGADQLVKLWDYESGQLLADGVGHSGTVNDLAFSPDGKQMVSVGNEGAIFVWNVYQ